jgi:hypothetical protein
MWIVALWAVLLPVVAVSVGALRWRRDFFFLLLYAQSVAYLDIAPTLASPDVPAAMQERYLWTQAWALVLFQLPAIALYLWFVRRRLDRLPATRRFTVSSWRLGVFLLGSAVLGTVYFVVGARYGLLYRRIGGDALSDVQFSMSLPEFALYRSFIEIGPFLIAAQMVLLRVASDMSPRMRRYARAGLVLTTVQFLGYAAINSRLGAAMTLVTLYAVANVVSPGRSGFSFRTVGATVMLFIGAAYAVTVVTNVRLSYSNGGSLFALENFLPISVRSGSLDDTLRWRLNGIDLIAMIADNVEKQGPAMGTAWAVPLVVSLDPIVRTAFTVEAKRANLTTAKTWLLLRYAGVGKADYYSCMLTDAYGNFSVAGFALAALVLAAILAWATAAVNASAAPWAVVFGTFFLTRLMTFEQEFGMVLYGWLKLLPFVLVAILFFPLRRAPHPTLA